MHSNSDARVNMPRWIFHFLSIPPPAKLNLNLCADPLSPNTMLGGIGKLMPTGCLNFVSGERGDTTKVEVKFRGGVIEFRQRNR